MAQQLINHGTTPGDGTGETLFSAFAKVNANETELYEAKTEAYANKAAFPVTGASGKLYLALDTGISYWWTGAIYAVVGNTSGTVTPAMLTTTTSGGVAILLPNGTSASVYKVSFVELGLTANTAALATGVAVPFNTVIRDDLGLTTLNGDPTKAYFPATARFIRLSLSLSYGYVAALDPASGAYRGFLPKITVDTATTVARSGITDNTFVPAVTQGSGSGGSEGTPKVTTGLIPAADFGMVNDNNFASVNTLHNSVAACVIKASSRLILEVWE